MGDSSARDGGGFLAEQRGMMTGWFRLFVIALNSYIVGCGLRGLSKPYGWLYIPSIAVGALALWVAFAGPDRTALSSPASEREGET